MKFVYFVLNFKLFNVSLKKNTQIKRKHLTISKIIMVKNDLKFLLKTKM